MKKGNKSALEAMLADLRENDTTQSPGEFTTQEIWDQMMAEGDDVTCHALRHRLDQKARKGEYLMRKILVKGKWTNVYRKA